MAELVLIRGVPGSGKSTMAKNKFPNHVHLEADMYHVDEDGNYKWVPENTPKGHKWCEEQTRKNLAEGKDVVVSNTFTRLWEMLPYFDMGADNVRVIEATGNYKNIHNVPDHAIERMRDRWEPYEGSETIEDEPLESDQSDESTPALDNPPKRRRPGRRPR